MYPFPDFPLLLSSSASSIPCSRPLLVMYFGSKTILRFKRKQPLKTVSGGDTALRLCAGYVGQEKMA